jgi:hypothetical protein
MSVFNQLYCFKNKIGVLFLRIKDLAFVLPQEGSTLCSKEEPWGPKILGSWYFLVLDDPGHSTRPLCCFPFPHHPSSYTTALHWTPATSQSPSSTPASVPLTTSRVLLAMGQILTVSVLPALWLSSVGGILVQSPLVPRLDLLEF